VLARQPGVVVLAKICRHPPLRLQSSPLSTFQSVPDTVGPLPLIPSDLSQVQSVHCQPTYLTGEWLGCAWAVKSVTYAGVACAPPCTQD
jgi:hypothetical protein